MRFVHFALLLALVSVAPRSFANVGWFHPDLTEAVQRLDRATGPSVYTELRRIWNTWDRSNPVLVEAQLLAAERSPRLTPSARAYAGLLAAYARLRLGDFKSGHSKIAALGYVNRWLVVGPFDNEGRAGLALDFEPELDMGGPIVPGRAFSGKERPVRWRPVPGVFSDGYLDIGALLRPEKKICAYAATFVRSTHKETQPRWISAWVGVGGAFKLYWNEKLELEDSHYRVHDSDRQAVALLLEPGVNRLTLKVCGDETAPQVSVRFAKLDGSTDTTLLASNDPGSEAASSKSSAVGTAPKAAAPTDKAGTATARRGLKPAPSVEGPLQAFERLAAKKPTAATLQSFAEYLVYTGSDDPTEHKARDLARRAAEEAPTLDRLLLAGRLAEDRNLQAEWLEKARTSGKQVEQNVDWLLAKALHERSGPSWQAALPYFDTVLRLEPDNLVALRSRVELYNQAGLERTALATLERALSRNPDSVTLVNMTASQLTALGRDREAVELETRYSALRFDDRGYLARQIKLALAQHDSRAAQRWTDRLIQCNANNQWALGFAAETYRALGQPERALASYRTALTLAPEDVETLRALADLQGELGRRDEQLETLQAVLHIRPQDVAVRDYVEHLEPARARADEAYAWSKERFLPLRHAPAKGANQRTLRELTVSTVFENGLSSQFRQVVFQPLTDAAAASARQYAFQYRADSQTVRLRGARVYRTSGQVDEAIESGEGAANDPSIAMYTSTRNFYVQFPPLQPGDVVELKYRVDDVTPRNEFADYFGEVRYLQALEPVAQAEYVLITPKSRTIYVDSHVPRLQQSVTEVGAQRIYRFTVENLEAIAPEPSMPPLAEVLGFVHVSTYKSWKDLGRWYWGLSKDQFDLDDETRKLAREIGKNARTDLEKVKAVYAWVIENTRYVALEFGIGGVKPRRCVQTVARGWGDCKDKATVIVTLLRELGVRSTLVILRTQMRGSFPSTLPSLAPFDHAIAYVPSLNLYLDGTAEYTGSSELPKFDLGALGLRINEGDAELVTLPQADPERNRILRQAVARLSPSGEARLELRFEASGTEAAEWRRRYSGEATRRDRLMGDVGASFPGFLLDKDAGAAVATGLTDIEQNPVVSVRGVAPGFARKEGERLSMAVTPELHLTADLAPLSQRKQDVQILAFSNIDETMVIHLPPNSKVLAVPPDANVDTAFGAYSISVTQNGRQVTVRSRLSVRKSRITPAEYAEWKRFCTAADKAFSPRLVLGT